MPLRATITRLPIPSVPRSSHNIAVLSSKLFIFSGERQPRIPEPHAVVCNLSSPRSADPTYIPATPSDPAPRVGAASATSSTALYLHSGRGGVDFTALPANTIHVFTQQHGWSLLAPQTSGGPVPEPRSYHTAAASPDNALFFIHGGCSNQGGRLSDLWSFNIANRSWRKLADAPGPGRGGPALCYHEGKLYRLGGFDGKQEIGGSVDVYDVEKDEWVVDKPDVVPPARSVCALVPVKVEGKGWVLVTAGGEGRPSGKGHEAAGKFWDDVWAYDVATGGWEEVEVVGDGLGSRGWFAAAPITGSEGDFVIHGGIGEDNERSGDALAVKLSAY